MTNPAPTAETGAAIGAGEPAASLVLPPNAHASIAPHILETLPARSAPGQGRSQSDAVDAPAQPPDAPESEDADPAEDSQAGDDTEDGLEGASARDAEAARLAEWVSLFDQNPNSITSIPRAQQGKVLAAHRTWEELAIGQALEEAYERGRSDLHASMTLQQQMSELDALLDGGDVPGFRRQLDRFPGGPRNYYAIKAQPGPTTTRPFGSLDREAEEVLARLESEHPERDARANARWDSDRSPVGLEQLRNDVATARAEAALARQHADPSQQKLTDRQRAADRRRSLPKPDVSPSLAGPGAPPTREEAAEWTAQQWMAYEAKHGKPAVDKLARSLSS